MRCSAALVRPIRNEKKREKRIRVLLIIVEKLTCLKLVELGTCITAARPILITHGWPGSVWEFYKLIPRLTDPGKYGGRDEDAFEVICPSIPGYGFSEAPHQQGF